MAAPTTVSAEQNLKCHWPCGPGRRVKRRSASQRPVITYWRPLAHSTAYQGGIVAWVAFWAFYGRGFGAENLVAVGSSGAAYMAIIVLEPLVDLAVLAVAKARAPCANGPLRFYRLRRAAAT